MKLMSKNVMVVLIALLLSGLVAELFLRNLYKLDVKSYPCTAEGHPAYTSRQCPTSQDRLNTMRFSRDLLYTPEPNSIGKGWSTDAHGFRNNGSLQLLPGSDTPLKEIKIAVTGGSTAWGVGVTDDQTLPAVLQKLLADRCQDSKVIVWNAAISAQTSGQERRRFETDILPLKPDIHIAFTGFNDIYNSYTGILPHQNRDYFEVGRHFGARGVDDFIPGLPKLEDYFLRISYLVSLAYFRLTYDPARVAEAINQRAANTDVTIDSSLRTARIFSNWARDYGYEYFYVLQPSIYSTQKILTSNEMAIKKSDEEFGNFHSRGYSTLKDGILRESGGSLHLNFVDADLAIANEEQDLFIDNVHFGDRGYSMLAKYMASNLLKTSSVLKRNCNPI
jgi:lysophospholipase L1-like esterase